MFYSKFSDSNFILPKFFFVKENNLTILFEYFLGSDLYSII